MDPRSEMSPKELAAVEQLRERIQDLLPEFKNDFWQHDLCLLRFLRARDLKVDKAETMLRKTLIWRRDNDVDSILDKKIPPEFPKEYPITLCGPDKDGNLVVINRGGIWDLRPAASRDRRESFINFVIRMFEVYHEFGRRWTTEDKYVTQIFCIMDMQGFNFAQMTSKEVLLLLRDTIQIFDAYYPEYFTMACVINAPKIFEIFYSLVKPMLAAQTAAKVHIYGDSSQWKPVLRKHIDLNNFPSEYGGAISSWPYYQSGFEPFPTYPKYSQGELKPVFVPPRDKHIVSVDVKKGMKLFWNFRTEGNDIGFQVVLDGVQQELVRKARVDSHITLQRGALVCEESGKYSLIFDNTYSSFTGKSLEYITWVDAQE